MTPPLYLALVIGDSHGILQGATVDNAHPFATLEECTQFVEQLETKALAQEEFSLVVKCLPVPATNP